MLGIEPIESSYALLELRLANVAMAVCASCLRGDGKPIEDSR